MAGDHYRQARSRILFTPILLCLMTLVMNSPAAARDSAWKDCELARSNPERSISACSMVLSRKTKRLSAAAFYNRGAAYAAKGDFDRSIADLSESIRLDPMRAFRFQERAEVFLKKGNYPAALNDINEAIRQDSTRAFRFHTRALIHQAAGNLAQAIADFDQAIRIDQPPRAFRFYERANAYRDLNQPARAIPDYDVVLRLEPNNAWVLLDRGRAYAKLGQKIRAKEDFEAAVRLYPNDAEVMAAVTKELAELAEISALQSLSPPNNPMPSVHAALRPVPERKDVRVALVIGNSRYRAASPLRNPGNDASAVAATFKTLGFASVQVEFDLDREETIRALRRFEQEAQRADWAVIYYSGHGVELDGANYLIPVDARLAVDKDVVDEAVALERVQAALEGAKKLRLVILDACRNNPLARHMKRTFATRSVGRGLASIEPEVGLLIAFAAKHGQEAIDGEGENSPFVRSLVTRLRQPNLEINKLFRLVRDDVLSATEKKQQPYTYGSLSGEDFFFNAR
jgi:tetratricopeptide (TPR) repeat protein